MRHSIFDFILNLKNIQRISKRKTQDYYFTILQKLFDLNFALFVMNVLLFFTKGINRLH